MDVHSLAAILRDTKESQEQEMFPGQSGVTHKNDVSKFSERKIVASRGWGRRYMADKESYVLLWDMLVLLLRQKGQVEGSVLAELLLKDSRDMTGHVVVMSNNRSRPGSHREIEGSTTSFASSVINEEVELYHDGQRHGEHCPHHQKPWTSSESTCCTITRRRILSLQ